MSDLLLTNVRPLGEPARDILVQGGRITEVGTGLRLAEGRGQVVDGDGQLTIPGLVDAHAHLGQDPVGAAVAAPHGRAWRA